ncbi:hypothetical protein AHF37_05397 [Paragonimus kellicotti]|nr:hypothetical protein AHF37_05397 [Paragonimus kellicotti]
MTGSMLCLIATDCSQCIYKTGYFFVFCIDRRRAVAATRNFTKTPEEIERLIWERARGVEKSYLDLLSRVLSPGTLFFLLHYFRNISIHTDNLLKCHV